MAVEMHNRYTLLNRSAEPLLDVAARRGVSRGQCSAVWQRHLLAKGLDAYKRYAYQDAPPTLVERTRTLATICQEYGVPLAAAALQFSLSNSHRTSTVVDVSKPERIAATLELTCILVPNELWQRLDAVGFDANDPEEHRFT
jgi:D-threo-aldose 1-dehydrogenase